MPAKLPKRECGCQSCRTENLRAFWGVIDDSYTSDDLAEFYPSTPLKAAVLIKKARQEEVASPR